MLSTSLLEEYKLNLKYANKSHPLSISQQKPELRCHARLRRHRERLERARGERTRAQRARRGARVVREARQVKHLYVRCEQCAPAAAAAVLRRARMPRGVPAQHE